MDANGRLVINATSPVAADIIEMVQKSDGALRVEYSPAGDPKNPALKLKAVATGKLKPAGTPVLAPKSPVKPSAPKPTFSKPSSDWTPVLPKDKPAATVKPNEPASLPTTTVVRISPNSNPRVVNIEVITCVGGDCASKPKIVRLTPEEADSIGEGSATARGIIQALFPNASIVVPRPRNPFSGDVPDAPEPVLNFSDSRAR